jgi:Na+-transporting methylmalonyl-CoA/oxaloacetate decarboxylase beta subunit
MIIKEKRIILNIILKIILVVITIILNYFLVNNNKTIDPSESFSVVFGGADGRPTTIYISSKRYW